MAAPTAMAPRAGATHRTADRAAGASRTCISSSAPGSPGRSRSVLSQDGRDGSEQDQQVTPRRPRLDVVDVQPDHVVVRQPRPSADLPQSGDAGADVQASAVPVLVQRYLVAKRGPGTYQAHVAP